MAVKRLNTPSFRQCKNPKSMCGLTLIELSVVLLILVGLAGLTLTMVQTTPRYTECVATDTTLANIREAIMGGAGQAGYLSDMGGLPPFDNNVSPKNALSLNFLFNNPNSNDATQSFNPVTQRGWRGPYITGGITCSKVSHTVNGYSLPYDIDKSLVCNLTAPLSHTIALDSFPVISPDGPTVLPGSPIVLMEDTSNGAANGKFFLVSGGPSNGIETTSINVENRVHTDGSAFDDRVLFLNSYDPSPTGNQPCSN